MADDTRTGTDRTGWPLGMSPECGNQARLGVKTWELSACKFQLGQWVGRSQEDEGEGWGEGQSRSQGHRGASGCKGHRPAASRRHGVQQRSKLPGGRGGEQMPQRGQDPWGQNISPLLSDLEFKKQRRSGFREVIVGSQQLTAHEFQNLSPSGR